MRVSLPYLRYGCPVIDDARLLSTIRRDHYTRLPHGGEPDVVVNLVDATNLECSLDLTSQVFDLGLPAVIALNRMDRLVPNEDAAWACSVY